MISVVQTDEGYIQINIKVELTYSNNRFLVKDVNRKKGDNA